MANRQCWRPGALVVLLSTLLLTCSIRTTVATPATASGVSAQNDDDPASLATPPSTNPHAPPPVFELSPIAFVAKVFGIQGKETGCQRSAGLQLIGGGSSKTGTKSLQMALELLGHKVYDMQTIVAQGHIRFLRAVAVDAKTQQYRRLYPEGRDDPERRAVVEEWHEAILDFGVTATLDSPMNFFFEELLELNPTAKVILTTHPSGNKTEWERSRAATWQAFAPITGWPVSFFFPNETAWGESLFGQAGCWGIWTTWHPWWAPWIRMPAYETLNREECAQGYEDLNERVRNRVPEGQLLDFSVVQGWRPLCDFLEVPTAECPDARGIPFPRVNTRSSNDTIRVFTTVVAVTWPLLVLLPVAVVAGMACCVVRCCRRCRRTDAPAARGKKDD